MELVDLLKCKNLSTLWTLVQSFLVHALTQKLTFYLNPSKYCYLLT